MQDLNIKLSTIIPIDYLNKRLDQTLATLFPNYSRENWKQWILDGSCLVNNKIVLPKYKIKGEEIINLHATLIHKSTTHLPENLPIKIIYEDLDLLIIDKPHNLVVHPGAGNWQGTLLNRLLHYIPNLNLLPRAGIIHRLDQDTTGLMIIAKSLIAYNNLIKQFKHHQIVQIYEAIVIGDLIAGGTINAPIGRNNLNRLKMMVTADGKPAITNYTILTRFNQTMYKYTHVKIHIVTGRTHQIRVHFNYLKYPILGDKLYTGAKGFNPIIKHFPRQALHAKELMLIHPINGNPMKFISNLPIDFQQLLQTLETLL